jgi:capsular exopolysaccharide synthesis family protein
MSRIQEILAKADREGTAGRLATRPAAGAPAPTVPAAVETALLRTRPFTAASDPVLPVPAAAPIAPRTATATLHPSLVAAIDPHSTAAEQYRSIRTRLTLREETGPIRAIAVTSPAARDGKSITAANLALAMSQELQRSVVLVDANLRNPGVHALFAVDAVPGFSEVLSGRATLDEALIYLPEFRLTLLPAGTAPEYPTELLGSTEMRRTLDALGSRFDRILLDLPAVTGVADAGTVAPMLDGLLMVVRAGHTQRPTLDQALAAIEPDKVLGVVLNEIG